MNAEAKSSYCEYIEDLRIFQLQSYNEVAEVSFRSFKLRSHDAGTF